MLYIQQFLLAASNNSEISGVLKYFFLLIPQFWTNQNETVCERANGGLQKRVSEVCNFAPHDGNDHNSNSETKWTDVPQGAVHELGLRDFSNQEVISHTPPIGP